MLQSSSILPSLLDCIFAKLLVTMAFTFTFPDVIVVSGLNKNIGGSTDLAKKRDGSTDFYTPIHPPRLAFVFAFSDVPRAVISKFIFKAKYFILMWDLTNS